MRLAVAIAEAARKFVVVADGLEPHVASRGRQHRGKPAVFKHLREMLKVFSDEVELTYRGYGE